MATYTPNYNLEKPAQNDIYNVDVFNSNSEIIDDAMGEINSHLVSMLVVPSASDEMSFVDAVRLKMSDLGIQSFVGEMYAVGGLRYQGFATFNDSYTQGSVVRVAFAGSPMYKYRYNGGTWTKDEYVEKSVTDAIMDALPYMESFIISANGTTSTTVTLSKPIKDYLGRTIIATANGGSMGLAQLVSVIPQSATTVTINWSVALPSSGTVRLTLAYMTA